MVWSGSPSSSVWEVASEEDDSHSGLAGLEPGGGASTPPVVGTPFGVDVVFYCRSSCMAPIQLESLRVLVLDLLKGLRINPWFLLGCLKGELISLQRGRAGSLQIWFWWVEVQQVGALLELLDLVDPQVVEATRFNPEDVLLHLLESRSTHLLDYLHEVGHVPQRLSFSPEQQISYVLCHVFKGLEYDLSPFTIREIIHLIVQKPIHEVSHVTSPP